MASWHSTPMEILYQTLGWIAFASWSFSFYPQVLLNYKRKRCLLLFPAGPYASSFSFFLVSGFLMRVRLSFLVAFWHLGGRKLASLAGKFLRSSSVVGLNFDFLVLNLTKHTSYLIYNAALFFSPVIQRQYREKYGLQEMIPVAANDVAFSTHAVLLTGFTLFQVLIYDRGTQKVSKTCTAITSIVWVSAVACTIAACTRESWLWLINVFNTIQVIMTTVKYIPQAFMNFRRKSTVGWSIGNILLDLLGGILNFGQMAVQSVDQGTWVNFYGNIGKTLISLEVIFFDLLFIIQHYILYTSKGEERGPVTDVDAISPLAKPSKSIDTSNSPSNVPSNV